MGFELRVEFRVILTLTLSLTLIQTPGIAAPRVITGNVTERITARWKANMGQQREWRREERGGKRKNIQLERRKMEKG